MKILMFGWEFPPHISGGLGTACKGLAEALSQNENIDITFVIPKIFGDESHENIKLLGANTVSLENVNDIPIKFVAINSGIVPYVSEEDYYTLKEKRVGAERVFLKFNKEGKIEFSGGYGSRLFEEISGYNAIASILVKKLDFDIIHAHDWLTFEAAMEVSFISQKPFVAHVHATDIDRSGGYVNPKIFKIEKEAFEKAERIIAVSNHTKDIIVDNYNINESKIEVVHNAVEQKSKPFEPKYKRGIMNPIVTFLGRITHQKGPEYFIEAAALVLKEMPDVHFVMAGSGDLQAKMIKLAASKRIANRIHFTGFLEGDEVKELLSMSNVYIMPSVSEPFGISPLEALTMGVPVIISKQSGVSEVINNAIKVDFWDIEAIADAIYAILNYKSLANTVSLLGKTEVEHFSWQEPAEKVVNIYSEITKQN